MAFSITRSAVAGGVFALATNGMRAARRMAIDFINGFLGVAWKGSSKD
jgi:hypothetical protein